MDSANAQVDRHIADSKDPVGDASGVFAALRRFASSRPPAERCELCSAELGPEHAHLLERTSHQISCSCEACAILFCGQQNARFKRIPRRIVELERFAFEDQAWDAMMLPINLAFFIRTPSGGATVWYPSPAGAMSSLLTLPAWSTLFAGDAILESVEPEVEALLANRMSTPRSHFVVPIDECYRLVGLIRTRWRGLSGGNDVWQSITDFFANLRSRTTHSGGATRA